MTASDYAASNNASTSASPPRRRYGSFDPLVRERRDQSPRASRNGTYGEAGTPDASTHHALKLEPTRSCWTVNAIVAVMCGVGFLAVFAGSGGFGSPDASIVSRVSMTAEERSTTPQNGLRHESQQEDNKKIPATVDKALHDRDSATAMAASDEGVFGTTPVVSSAVEPLQFRVTNFYHERDGKPGALIPWLDGVKLAEPYRETSLIVTSPREGYTYDWEIRSITESDGIGELSSAEVLAQASGAVVQVQFTKLDLNAVTVWEVDEVSGQRVRELTETVMVKYVRRELRTLTDEERDELLDAMATLWKVKVKDGNGRELYGENYQDIWAINRLHFKAGGARTCDHFHEGLGFLVSHALLTNTFEASLQLVNPKLTVPYWDFTIEKSSFGGSTADKNEPQMDSPLFKESWFGGFDPDDFMVKDGRWAYTEIPSIEPNNPAQLEPDVYSKLRSPWNVNRRPYLTRGMGEVCGLRIEDKIPWSTCADHYKLTTENFSFYSWVWDSMFDPHGNIHSWIGGMIDCRDMYATFRELVDSHTAETLAYFAFTTRKYLYRNGLWSCDGSADIETSPAEVMQSMQCGCLGLNLESGDDYLIIRDAVALLSGTIEDYPEDIQRRVVAVTCSNIMTEGDHIQSSSSLEPTFWAMHPTMERLWMFKRITGTMMDLTWPDTNFEVKTGAGETECGRLSFYDESCNGHRGSDVFPFSLASDAGSGHFQVYTGIRGDDTPGGNSIANRDVLQLLDPRVNSLNYIYDHFEWKHCMADGYDMNDAWVAPINVSEEELRRPSFKAGEPLFPRYAWFLEQAAKIQEKRLREA